MLGKSPLISIIVPVYNGAEYLVRLLNSLKSQSFGDFEVLLLDDGSTDNSVEIIKQYIQKDKRFRLCLQSRQGSNLKMIEHSFKILKGKYFFYLSQDDWISDDLLTNLYQRAIETGADNILPDMIWAYDNDISKGIFPPQKNYSLQLSGKEAFLLSLGWKIHGFGLKNAKLYQQCWISSSLTNQDEFIERLFLLRTNKTVFSKGIVYYYQGNSQALTKKFSPNRLDWLETNFKILDLMKDKNFSAKQYRFFLKECVKEFIATYDLFIENKSILSSEQITICNNRFLYHKKLLMIKLLKNLMLKYWFKILKQRV